MNKTIIKSLGATFLISLLFIAISFIYVFSGLGTVESETRIGQILIQIITYPVINIWGAGYSEGYNSANIAAIRVLLIVWIVTFIIYHLIRQLRTTMA